MDNKKVRRLTSEIERHFAFLFDRGYRIVQADCSDVLFGYWTVTLQSSSSLIYLTNRQDHITLEFSATATTDPRQRITIERLLSKISDGREIVVPFRNSMVSGRTKQLERLASLLQSHLDQIMAYFSGGSRP